MKPIINKKIDDETKICPVCSRMPCYVISMGPVYLKARHEYRATTGNGNASVRLGRGVRVQVTDCMERFINFSFPNEDGADYVGFVLYDKHEW